MFNFLKLFKSFLPLYIKNITWDEDFMIISGDTWSFSTGSAWRVSKGNKLLFTCWDNDADAQIEGLAGLEIVDFSWLIVNQPIDPSICFFDGRHLDIFCSFSCEPWIIKLPNDNIYIGNS